MRVAADQLVRQTGQTLVVAVGPAILDKDVPAFRIAEIAKPVPEGIEAIFVRLG
jgi:hypothetical protein